MNTKIDRHREKDYHQEEDTGKNNSKLNWIGDTHERGRGGKAVQLPAKHSKNIPKAQKNIRQAKKKHSARGLVATKCYENKQKSSPELKTLLY